MGYELLYRDAPDASSAGASPLGSGATAHLLADAVIVDGLASIVGSARGWINLTERLIVDAVPEMLPPHRFVLEILENVPPSPAVLEGCRRLRAAGFPMALDDVVGVERMDAFAGCFDIVKVDWRAADATAIPAIVGRASAQGASLLAEKLETEVELSAALDGGFDLFQGYAIGMPRTLQPRTIEGINAHTVRLLQIVNSQGFDYAEAEAAVRADPALTYKILAFANSSLAAQSRRVNDLRRALVLFGERNLRHAVLLIFLAQSSGGAPAFALVEALTAGLFSEAVARAARRPELANACMLAATLSHLDRLLGASMRELLQRLSVGEMLQEALIKGDGPVGAFVQLARSFQQGNWEATDALVRRLGLTATIVQRLYQAAITSSELLIRGETATAARPAA